MARRGRGTNRLILSALRLKDTLFSVDTCGFTVMYVLNMHMCTCCGLLYTS